MFYAYLSIFMMLNFFSVNASSDSLHSSDSSDDKAATLPPSNARVIKDGKRMSEHQLKKREHQLRMSLMRPRSPSLGPPTASQCARVEEQLAAIDEALSSNYLK